MGFDLAVAWEAPLERHVLEDSDDSRIHEESGDVRAVLRLGLDRVHQENVAAQHSSKVLQGLGRNVALEPNPPIAGGIYQDPLKVPENHRRRLADCGEHVHDPSYVLLLCED